MVAAGGVLIMMVSAVLSVSLSGSDKTTTCGGCGALSKSWSGGSKYGVPKHVAHGKLRGRIACHAMQM